MYSVKYSRSSTVLDIVSYIYSKLCTVLDIGAN